MLKWLVGREVQLGRLAVGGVVCLDGLLVVRLSAWVAGRWSGAQFGRLAFSRVDWTAGFWSGCLLGLLAGGRPVCLNSCLVLL